MLDTQQFTYIVEEGWVYQALMLASSETLALNINDAAALQFIH